MVGGLQCKHFIEQVMRDNNLSAPPSLDDCISSARYWGNDVAGRVFCLMFNIDIFTYNIERNLQHVPIVQTSFWSGGQNKVNLVTDEWQTRNTGYLYCYQNIHFSAFDHY